MSCPLQDVWIEIHNQPYSCVHFLIIIPHDPIRPVRSRILLGINNYPATPQC